jgi:acyl dehydratase
MNQELAGKSYPPLRYEVGREKLREFAAAVGETAPVYHDEEAARAAGHPDLPATPTFPVVISNKLGERVYADPELGLDFSRVVHSEQELSFERPVHAGDRLVATARIAGIRALGRHELLVVETTLTTEDGEPVCATRSTLLSRDTAPRDTAPRDTTSGDTGSRAAAAPPGDAAATGGREARR